MSNEFKIGTPNKSQTYILPMIGRKLSDFASDVFPFSNYRNTFIGDKDKPSLKNNILLLYRFSNEPQFLELEKNFQTHRYFHSIYEPDSFHTMIVFNIPEQFQREYDLFKQSKYSLFSESYKRHIGFFHNINLTHEVMGTLYKTEWRFKQLEKKFGIEIPRNQEAGSAMNEADEYYQPHFKIMIKLDKNE